MRLTPEQRKAAEQERMARTKELAAEVKAGTYKDHRTNTMESWFPNRGIIKKDEAEVARVLRREKNPKVKIEITK